MLTRRDFGGGLAAGAVARWRGSDRPAPAPTPAPAKEPNLARILRTKRLRITAPIGEEPYFYRDPGTGQWTGFCVDMGRNLAAELGVDLAVVESIWADWLTDLQANKIDLSYGLNPTAQRAMFVDFSNPLYHDTFAIVARKGFAAKKWTELNAPESLIAVDIGSSREASARRFAGNATITGFKTRDEAILAVQSGRADCFVATVFLALTTLKENPEVGEFIIPVPHLRAAVCVAMPYDDDRRFRGVVDAWCEDSRTNGQIREWIVAALAKLGIEPGDLPSDVSF